MAKRFIDSNIFRKSFLKGIDVEAKLFYIYLFCECDHTGVWEVEFEVAKVRLGLKNLSEQEVLNYFAEKIIVFDNGAKWFMPQFVKFQYGDLKANNKIHKSVLSNLTKFNLLSIVENYDETKHLPNPYQSIKDKDKDKDMEKDKDKEKVKDNVDPTNLLYNDSIGIVEDKVFKGKRKFNQEAKNTEKTKDYNLFIDAYAEFLKFKGIPVSISVVDGKAMKLIIAYLNAIDSVKSGSKSALDIWKYILANWSQLTPWMQTQIQIRQINSQLPNIIQSLRNGKQTNNSAQQLAEALRGAISNGGSL